MQTVTSDSQGAVGIYSSRVKGRGSRSQSTVSAAGLNRRPIDGPRQLGEDSCVGPSMEILRGEFESALKFCCHWQKGSRTLGAHPSDQGNSRMGGRSSVKFCWLNRIGGCPEGTRTHVVRVAKAVSQGNLVDFGARLAALKVTFRTLKF